MKALSVVLTMALTLSVCAGLFVARAAQTRSAGKACVRPWPRGSRT